jgi:hypothetical protein
VTDCCRWGSLELLGNDMGINMFGCSAGSAGERKLHVQGDAGGKVNVLGGGSVGSCNINCNSGNLLTYGYSCLGVRILKHCEW